MNNREINFIKLNGVIFLLIIFLYSGCTKEPVSPETTLNDGVSINAYIRKLIYNPKIITGLSKYRVTKFFKRSCSDTATSTSGDQQVTFIMITYNLKENFENIAILRPMSGVIWPGALEKGNQSMMDGLPGPNTLPRGVA